mmetsp:Transcript_6532/g.20930  ORF Transcript_6532/g.20930 Transcript_6532/m.20930 type:complete len:81 (-) Transcript_6532:437-679(-)
MSHRRMAAAQAPFVREEGGMRWYAPKPGKRGPCALAQWCCRGWECKEEAEGEPNRAAGLCDAGPAAASAPASPGAYGGCE